MAVIVFRKGIAPIPKGATVMMTVDDVNNPTEASWIWDMTHDIKYTREPKAALAAAPKAGSIHAVVERVVVRARGGSDLTVRDIKPIPEGGLRPRPARGLGMEKRSLAKSHRGRSPRRSSRRRRY